MQEVKQDSLKHFILSLYSSHTVACPIFRQMRTFCSWPSLRVQRCPSALYIYLIFLSNYEYYHSSIIELVEKLINLPRKLLQGTTQHLLLLFRSMLLKKILMQ